MIQTAIENKEIQEHEYSISYYCSGDPSKEVIIFLHAAFVDHRCFNNQIDFFSKNYRVITIDLLGHGKSKPLKSKDKIDVSIFHISYIMEKERCFYAHFVGVSMGSIIAQQFGYVYPEKVLSLTSVGGYYIHANNTEIIRAQRSEQLKWLWRIIISMNLFRKYVASVSVNKTEQQALFYEMAKPFTRKSLMLMQGLENILERIEEEEIPYPMLLICGEHDIELAKKANTEWHNTFPKSSMYVEIKNAGHCANMDNPDVWNKTVLEFIQKK